MTFREHYGINEELIRFWVERSPDVIHLVGQISRHLRERFRASLFFEKSPTNAYGMRRASETLPGVKLVHMIRDGRDVVPSLARRGWNLFGAGSCWLYDTVRGLEARGSENYLELRYEDLVF